MTGYRAPAPILLALALACLFVGGRSCATDASPQLVRVLEVAPREVEVGDRIVIIGDGFPPGRPARVTFRGTLYRPGERPVRGAAIVVLAAVVAPNRVELAFDDSIQALFSGAGDRATHTTFDGDVEVAFAAAASGAAPIAGLLQHVTVDVRPSASPSLHRREGEGERALAWIGVRAVRGASGLVVNAVQPGSPAQAAGIVAGDVVTTFDGVRVASAADVVPPPGEPDATIGVRSVRDVTSAVLPRGQHADDSEIIRVIPMHGFRRAPPAELVGASVLVLAALGVVWLFGAPTRAGTAASLQRVVSRVRERFGVVHPFNRLSHVRLHGMVGAPRKLVGMLSVVARDALPPHRGVAGVDAVGSALLAAMPFGQYVVAARLDVGLLFVGAMTCLAAAAFVARRSMWQGVRSAVDVVWQHAPAAAAAASVVVTTGSMRFEEIEHAQGAWPWDWLAFRSPAGLVACGLFLGCSLIEPEVDGCRSTNLSALVEAAPPASRARPEPWLEVACRAHRFAVAGLASVLFLGGGLLPGLGRPEQVARPALELAGAVVLLAKTWSLVLLMASTRLALPGSGLRQGTRATMLWVVPLAVAALVATTAWIWWNPPPAAQLLVSVSLVVAVGLAGVALAHRLHHGLMSPAADAHLSPFL